MYYLDLFKEVQELLDFPIPQGQNIKTSKTGQAVRAVFKAIVNGLQRGEKVRVAGFGTFSIRIREPRKNHWFEYDPVTKQRYMVEAMEPAKKYVHFSPTAGLRKFVNEGLDDGIE